MSEGGKGDRKERGVQPREGRETGNTVEDGGKSETGGDGEAGEAGEKGEEMKVSYVSEVGQVRASEVLYAA